MALALLAVIPERNLRLLLLLLALPSPAITVKPLTHLV